MNQIFPPFSKRFELNHPYAKILISATLILIFPCTYLLSDDEQNKTKNNLQQLALLDPPANKEVPDQSEPGDDVSDDREALIHRIYRNRSLRTQLERAERKFRNDEFTEAALQLEKLLDHKEDCFFWPEDQARPSNFRQRTRALFSTASHRSLSDYERISGPQANWLLEIARANNDVRMYEHVALRFFPLQAGFESLHYLASHFMEHGNFEFATRYWDLLLNSRIHKSRMKSIHFLKAAVAYQQTQQRGKVSKILSTHGNKTVNYSGKKSSLSHAFTTLNISIEQMPVHQDADWLVAQGNTHRNHSTNASLPFLNPRWSQPIARTNHSPALAALKNWEGKQNRENLSTAIANLPIAIGNQVIYRDFEGIRAVNIDSGKTNWIFQSEGSLNRLIDRVANRIRSHSTYSQNLPLDKFYHYGSIYGSLASNRQFVFAIDYLPDSTPEIQQKLNLGLRRNTTHFPLVSRRGNRLIALPIQQSATDITNNQLNYDRSSVPRQLPVKAKTAWSLEGYYFLGAPLPVGNQIYALAEHDSQISLLCINPQNGNINWKQGIAYVNQPIRSDRTRSFKHCPLASSQGIIVCTTQIDTLVAVDATNGDLLWNYYYGEGIDYRRISQKRYLSPISFGHRGFTSPPVIDDQRIYYLPSGSPYIHCIDLTSGLPLWSAVPREDGEYIAAVVDETVLVVGSNYCRGRHIQDGRELWHLDVGPVTGKGFLSNNKYLLPIKAGCIISIDIPTGTEFGFSLSNSTQISEILNRDYKQKLQQQADYAYRANLDQSQSSKKTTPQHKWSPGNIISHQGQIISLGLWQIDAFPQAEAMLTSLQKDRSLPFNSPEEQNNQLLKAELELALGNLKSAQLKLESLLSTKTTALIKKRSESLLRELLYAELNKPDQYEPPLLTKLETLATTPLERGRFLSRKSKYLLQQHDYEGLMAVAEEFKKIEVKQPLAMAGDSNHLVTVNSLIAGLMEKITSKADQDAQKTLDLIISNDQQIALEKDSIDSLQSFLDTYGSWPQAVEVRVILAEKLIQQGQNQRAEFLLMENRSHPDTNVAGPATKQLLELWKAMGLPHEAASLLREIQEQYATTFLDSGLTGAQYLNQFDRASRTWSIFQSMQPLAQSVSHVSIQQSDLGDPVPEIKNTYKNYERKFLPPPDISHLLLKKGAILNVINKHVGQNIGKIEVSDRISYPYHSQNTRVGHFIPLGSRRKIHGVSLLQLQDQISKPLWTTEFNDLNSSQSLFYVGPSGPRVCIFQWDKRLIGLDPATGKVLWERKNIPSKSGFLSDSSKGLIGDQKAVVAFNINRTNYDVYSSITGELIRKGELDLNSRSRHVFGRKLFYQTTSTTEKRVRLWDPLTDSFLLDEPISNSGLSTQVSPTELAILLPSNRVRVLNVNTGETIIETTIPDEYTRTLNKFIGFSDGNRYYFNFSYTTPRRRSPLHDFFVSDSFLNVVHVDNDLICIDKKTGKMLWNRNLPKRSWVNTSQYQLPFLIFMSKIRTESKTRSYSLLFEIIDAQTGNTIGLKDNIIKDTILHMHIDPQFKKLILQGMKSAIEIDFGDKTKALHKLFETPL